MFRGQPHAEPTPGPMAHFVISVPSPHQIPAEDARHCQVLVLPKMHKKSRQLDCGNFDDASAAMVAKNWL